MGCRLRPKRRLSAEVARVWRTQLAKSASRLALSGGQNGTNHAQGIHAARQRIKRLRSMVKLFRKPLGPLAVNLNTALRDAANTTSLLRDADVLQHTFEFLMRNKPTSKRWRFAPLAHTLALTARPGRPTKINGIVRRFRTSLTKLADREREIREYALQVDDIRFGLRNSYRKARRAFQDFLSGESIEHLHEWRKRSKDVFYQLELVSQFSRRPQKQLRRRWKKLGGLLGRIRDIELLANRLEAAPRKLIRPRTRKRLVARCGKLVEKLLSRARALGRNLAQMPPRKFVRQLRRPPTAS